LSIHKIIMSQKIRFHSIYLYLFLIVVGTEFTACHHKQKVSDDPIVKEMPLPDPDKNYYSPKSFHQKVHSEDIYNIVEQMPEFPGGDKALISFLARKIKYPIIAQENGIQGRVIIRFVVTRTGEVENPEILRSLDPACDKEALRVVKSFPKWKSGIQNGRKVNVYFILPIKFSQK